MRKLLTWVGIWRWHFPSKLLRLKGRCRLPKLWHQLPLRRSGLRADASTQNPWADDAGLRFDTGLATQAGSLFAKAAADHHGRILDVHADVAFAGKE